MRAGRGSGEAANKKTRNGDARGNSYIALPTLHLLLDKSVNARNSNFEAFVVPGLVDIHRHLMEIEPRRQLDPVGSLQRDFTCVW